MATSSRTLHTEHGSQQSRCFKNGSKLFKKRKKNTKGGSLLRIAHYWVIINKPIFQALVGGGGGGNGLPASSSARVRLVVAAAAGEEGVG